MRKLDTIKSLFAALIALLAVFGAGRVWADSNLVQVPYRDWDPETKTASVDATTNAVVVESWMRELEGGWYVVTTDLELESSITVLGTTNAPTHLILADGAKLTVTNAEDFSAGILVTNGAALVIHDQALGTGALETRGGEDGAGIGGADGVACGSVTVIGGEILAIGGECAAGIGGCTEGNGGDVAILGGSVSATGGAGAAGIGGGWWADGGCVTILGGTVIAARGPVSIPGDPSVTNASDIGCGETFTYFPVLPGVTVINGGSVKAETIAGGAVNGAGEPVYCVTVPVGTADPVALRDLELHDELGTYGIGDIHPIDEMAYIYLPNGFYSFRVGRTELMVEVEDGPATADLPPELWYWDDSQGELVWTNRRDYVFYDAMRHPALEDDRWYVVRAREMPYVADSIEILGTNGAPTHLVLEDGAYLRAVGYGDEGYDAGVHLPEGRALVIHGQADGTGILNASAEAYAAGIGGENGENAGSLTVDGGTVIAEGAEDAAGIGGGPYGCGGTLVVNHGTVKAYGGDHGAGIGSGMSDILFPCDAGTVTINGGDVSAIGGFNAAGIGGGIYSAGADVTINGGTVIAQNGGDSMGLSPAADIGAGSGFAGAVSVVTIDGGSVFVGSMDGNPVNSNGDPVYRVPLEVGEGEIRSISGLDGYGTNDVHQVEGTVAFYLPNGTYGIAVVTADGGVSKVVVVEDGEIEMYDHIEDPRIVAITVSGGTNVTLTVDPLALSPVATYDVYYGTSLTGIVNRATLLDSDGEAGTFVIDISGFGPAAFFKVVGEIR